MTSGDPKRIGRPSLTSETPNTKDSTMETQNHSDLSSLVRAIRVIRDSVRDSIWRGRWKGRLRVGEGRLRQTTSPSLSKTTPSKSTADPSKSTTDPLQCCPRLWMGIGLLGILHTINILVTSLLWDTLMSVSLIGITQLVYVIPTVLILTRIKKDRWIESLAIGSAVTILLNPAITGAIILYMVHRSGL